MSPNDSTHNGRFSLLSRLHGARDLMKPGRHCVTNVLAQWLSFFVYNCNVTYIFLKQLWHTNIFHCAIRTKMPISLIRCHICPLNGMYGGFFLVNLQKIPLLTVPNLPLLEFCLGSRYF